MPVTQPPDEITIHEILDWISDNDAKAKKIAADVIEENLNDLAGTHLEMICRTGVLVGANCEATSRYCAERILKGIEEKMIREMELGGTIEAWQQALGRA